MKSLFKRIAIFSLLLVFGSLWAQEKPNIIIVLTDDMGFADIGAFGSPNIETPFIDSLGHNGFMATNYEVSSPSCTPSRASLLTGRYSSRYNLPDPIAPGSPLGLPDEEVTIAEALKEAGYNTGMVGKWHLGDQKRHNKPNGQGFDFFYGMLYSQDYRHPYVQTDTVIKIFRNEKPEIYEPADSMLTRLYTQESIQFIEKQSKEKPFFLYLAHNMPHLPVYFAAQSNYLKTKPGGPLGAVISEMDDGLKSIWEALEAKGMAENTIFILRVITGLGAIIHREWRGMALPSATMPAPQGYLEGRKPCPTKEVEECLLLFIGKVKLTLV